MCCNFADGLKPEVVSENTVAIEDLLLDAESVVENTERELLEASLLVFE